MALTTRVRSPALLVLLAAAIPLLSACTQPADPQAMVAAPTDGMAVFDPGLAGAIAVGDVSSVGVSDQIWTSEIGMPAFRDALNQSLTGQGLLAAVPAGSRYTLDAQMLEMSQPAIAFDMTVETRIGYTLTDTVTGEQPFAETISSEGTASMGDALNGDDRRRMAAEAAAGNNIRQFLERLASVRLP